MPSTRAVILFVLVLFLVALGISVAIFLYLNGGVRSSQENGSILGTVTFSVLAREISSAYEVRAEGLEAERRLPQPGFATTETSDTSIVLGRASDSSVLNISRTALIAEEATRRIVSARIHGTSVSAAALAHLLSQREVNGTRLERECPEKKEPLCPLRRYRSYNGHCNNVENPHWGQARTAYSRFLPAAYADGISEPRTKSLANRTLPSARRLSTQFYRNADRQVSHVTLALVVMSEFVANDISFTAPFRGPGSERPKCCGVTLSDFHSECFPIGASFNDPAYGNRSCLEFVRSAPAVRTGCRLGPREQLNLATSFLDGSSIYGNSETTSYFLRSFEGGQLRISDDSDKPMPPALDAPRTCKGEYCVLTGDARANENAGLAAMHTLWFREHNRVASILTQLNPHWSDNRTFEETRRVIVAELQHIVYAEILPTLLGEEVMEQYKLTPRTSGYSSGYSTSIVPSTTNEAATAVLHFVLSMMPSHLDLYTTESTRTGRMQMMETYFDSEVLLERFDEVLLGLVNQEAQPSDEFIAPEMAQPSYTANRPDPIAALVQRGRDHGLASYTDYRRYCKLQPAINRTEDLARVMSSSTARRLMELYDHVDDIDLLLGGLAEHPREGAVVGATFACLLAEQFQKLKNGDRFYYEHNVLPSRFSERQLVEIRKSTLSRLLCDNADDAKSVQPTSTLMPDDFLNANQHCTTAPKMDFAPWRSPATNALNATEAEGDLRALSGTFEKSERDSEHYEGALGVHGEAVAAVPKGSTLDPKCDETILPCDPTTKYRTITGWCNNLRSPRLGKSFSNFSRFAPASYGDGISEMKTASVSGKPLPNARLVSTSIHYDAPEGHRKYSLAFMQWGQFLDHDLTLTPVAEVPTKPSTFCKRCDSAKSVHPECRPIPIPTGDHFFPEKLPDGADNCISFLRSLPAGSFSGPREQINQVTAFLDASNVYGSTVCQMRRLRAFAGGRLNVTENAAGGKPLLPQIATHKECRSRSGVCFSAGDDRASEQPGLATLHTVFVRAHNFFVDGLSQTNPHWDDEKLFQEGRRIVSAVFQRITYGEFLPRLLGRSAMAEYGLDLAPSGYVRTYDPDVDTAVFNEFGTAAFRFGHSLIAPFFKLLGESYVDHHESVQLRRGFFDSDMLYEPGAIDAMLRGLVSASMRNRDNAVTAEVTNHLFRERNQSFSGLDLVALNIQRGRDHGLPGYNAYRELCGLRRARSFSELKEIAGHLRQRLQNLYDHVDDVDLFTGGMAETSERGALVGPTFSCIIGKQFQRLKKSDRFFFETDDPAVRFTEDQLLNIRRMTLSRIICDNSDDIQRIQQRAFDQPDGFHNPRIACSTLEAFDFAPWTDPPECHVEGVSIKLGQSEKISPCYSCVCTAEGPKCSSIGVESCAALAREVTVRQLLADERCRLQCFPVLAALHGSSTFF